MWSSFAWHLCDPSCILGWYRQEASSQVPGLRKRPYRQGRLRPGRKRKECARYYKRKQWEQQYGNIDDEALPTQFW